MLSIEHYYAALRDAVTFYPSGSKIKCLQPQTFIVLESLANMSMENLGKTPCERGKPYFFSRLWRSMRYNPSALKFEFPLVGAFEVSAEVEGLFSRKTTQCYDIQLIVVDAYSENCEKGKCAGCDGRNGNEIFRDTEIMLHNVLDYLISCNVVTYDGNATEFLHPKALSDAYVANGDATTYEIDIKSSNKYKMELRQGNTRSNVFRFDGKNGGGKTINDLYGTIVNLKLCMPRCIEGIVPDYSVKDPGVSRDLGCCG